MGKTAVLFIAILFVSFAHADINSGLVAYYSFNGNANDYSGNHFDGTLQNSPAYVNGISGQALNFNGTQGVYINGSAGHSSPLNLYNTSVTLSAWIKLPAGHFGTIVTRAKPHYVTYKMGTGSQNIIINNYRSPNHWDLSTNNILELNTWHHVVGVFDRVSDIGRIYIDGVERAAGSIPFDPVSCDGITKIGCRNDIADQPFVGQIDEVYIYNRALSAQDVRELYTIPEPATLLLLLGLGGMMLRRKK